MKSAHFAWGYLPGVVCRMRRSVASRDDGAVRLSGNELTNMLRTHANRTGSRLAGSLSLLGVLAAPHVFAQVPTPAAAPVDTPAAPTPPPAIADAPPPTATAASPTDAPPALDAATLNAKVERLQRAFDELKKENEDAADATAIGAAEDGGTGEEPLRIYGFTDLGVQHIWVNEQSLLSRVFQVNNTSFVVGNVNLYFDAQPVKHFRGLTELRFTNAPLGDIVNYGGLAGTFKRKDTFSYDSGGTAINASMWGGTVVLERAWLEWNQHQALKIRAGNFFTPFGIWNADHGSPTLISLALPQFILQRWMPLRQTGVMLYGNAFAGDWELGYIGTLTNGRQEISNYNFDNGFGIGGRVYARRDTGQLNTTFGLSYFTGKTSDVQVDFVASPDGLNGIAAVEKKTWAYTEHVAGADASLDIDATRVRAEAIVKRLVYEPGHRLAGDPLYAPGSFAADSWQEAAYLLVANQLPWAGLEPYVFGEVQEQPVIIGDFIITASVGLNVHFNSSVQLKTQATRAYFMDWLLDTPYKPSDNNVTSLYSRLVMAF
jgi:hypothetical protein